MKASEALHITKIAREDGYDYVIDAYLKKVKRAAYLGEDYIDEAILPWFSVETKHINWFIDRGYKVDVESKKIIIKWG